MIRLAGIFGNGMILQRDTSYKIWGYDDTAPEVVAVVDGSEHVATVENGRFIIEMPPHKMALDLTVTVSGSSTITLKDVCFGDVFYLSGQSNMELPVYRTMDVSEEEIRASHYPYIRQYRVTPAFELSEDVEIDLPDQPWTRAEGDELMQLSAAGFYCAKHIYDEKKVPIGLVLGAQGGSTIEAWMPSSLLPQTESNQKIMSPFMKEGALVSYLQKQDQLNAKWRGELESPEDKRNTQEIPADASVFTVPGMLRKQDGNGFTGILWCYKKVVLEEEPKEDAFLYLGDLIDADQTFVNGYLVGRTEYRYPPRKYPFDGRILHRGENLIAVRLLIENEEGGFVGAHPYYLRSGEETISLEGDWLISYGKTPTSALPVGVRGQVVPTALYKTSVFPLRNYAFCGNWWYQGESNTDDPTGYAEKFKALMTHWRQLYQQTMPLICIEMPDYTDPITGEIPDGWASIQAQQRQASTDIPDCVVVSAKDLMTPLELHPQRKSELGIRMAKAALALYK